jgi:hypothetical protein
MSEVENSTHVRFPDSYQSWKYYYVSFSLVHQVCVNEQILTHNESKVDSKPINQ